jgi:hypothetical protein
MHASAAGELPPTYSPVTPVSVWTLTANSFRVVVVPGS